MTVIGIAGIKGEPTVKRTLVEVLRIDYLASQVTKERILWVRDDPFIQSLSTLQGSLLGISESQLHPGRLQSSTHEYACNREAVGLSAARALILSVEIAELIY